MDATGPAPKLDIVDGDERDEELDELRQLLLEVADSLDAIVIALQTERQTGDVGLGLREAVWRVVRLRRHLGRLGYVEPE